VRFGVVCLGVVGRVGRGGELEPFAMACRGRGTWLFLVSFWTGDPSGVFCRRLVWVCCVGGVWLSGIFKLRNRCPGDVMEPGGVCWAVVAWQRRMINVGPACMAGQGLDVFAPGGAVAGVEVGHSVGWAKAIDGIVVVGPEELLVGCLSNDVGRQSITVCKALVGWELLSVL